MASDDGEHTRFPCLATLRSLVATVVTVLAVVVVALVIFVVHRPEEISLSISQGYVQSEQLWWTTETKYTPVLPFKVGSAGSRDPRKEDEDDDPDESPYRQPLTTSVSSTDVSTTYAAAKPPVSLRFTWSAHNPSGRGKIDCNITSIRIFDMPNPPSTGKEIGSIIYPDEPLRFSVPSQATHKDTAWVVINDTATLQYIFEQYEGRSSFSAMLQVNAIITSKAMLSSTKLHSVNHSCRPVNVVYGTPDDTAYGDIACTMDEHPPFPFVSQPPAPAPGVAAFAG